MSDSEPEYDEVPEADDQPVLSPPLLMRSFLTIASSSVACLLLYAIVGMSLAAMFFPNVWDALTADPTEAAAAGSIPLAMVALWLILHGACCVGIGWITAKVAPFAPNKHGLILAIFLFIGWMQKVFESDPNKLGMNAAFTIVVPLAIAYGARRYSDSRLSTDSLEDSLDLPSSTGAPDEVA